MHTETQSAVILQLLPGIGNAGLIKLVERFGAFDSVLQANLAELPAKYRAGIAQYQARRTQYQNSAARVIDACENIGVSVTTVNADHYPALLKEIPSPPPVLYIRGDINAFALPQIAIVGSRQHSVSGEKIAAAFARTLSASGFAITSGLALGIDAAAHRGAMQQGATIAVLGTGIDIVYPRRHSDLYHAIVADGGAVVSEFLPGTPPRAANFPQRNRIISGLSLGVLVIEAALRSGSLITARHALNQGREVFAVPGSIHSPMSKGCHQLIREGATLVEKAEDIVIQLGGMLSFIADSANTPRQHLDLDSDEASVLAELGFDPVDLDTLVSRSGLSVADLISILTSLELKSVVENRAGLYVRVC